MSSVTTLTDRQRELAHLYGSTEAAALMGEDPFSGPIDVYRRHVDGWVDEGPASHHIERGVFLEAPLRRWSAVRIGHAIDPGDTFTSDDFPLMRSTPDGLVVDEATGRRLGVLEVKSPGPRTAREWDFSATDERGVPARYVIQCTQHMICSGLRKCWISALVFGDLHIWEIPWDPDLAQSIVSTIEHFHEAHVRTRIPPPEDGSKTYTEWLNSRHPEARRSEVEASEMLVDAMRDLREAKDKLDYWSRKKERCEQTIKRELGDAEQSYVSGLGRVTWTNQKGRVAWKKLAEFLGASNELIDQHRGSSPRVMRINWED